MKYGLLNLFLFAISVAQAPPTRWKAFPVNAHLTIQFPASAQEMDVAGTLAAAHAPKQHDPQVQASRAVRGEDAAATYVLVMVPFSGVNQVPAQAAARADYYKNHLAPLLIAHAHGVLLAQESASKSGVDMLTVKFQVLNGGGVPVVRYLRVFTVEHTIYELFFAPKDGTGQTCAAQRNRFFETLTIRK